MAFDWDRNKAHSNLRRHGVSFEVATKVFDDPTALAIPDDCTDEERWQYIGRVGSAILFVVYTERDDDIRIISARKATRSEEEAYYQQAG